MAAKRLESETDEYRAAREELLQAEIALKDQCKRVADMRAKLPEGPVVEDYLFQEGPADLGDPSEETREVRLSELFVRPQLPLILNHLMYGGAQENPCPMCSMWADGYNAVVRHLSQRANFATVVEAEIGKMRAWARKRGWNNMRIVSSHATGFKTDLKMQDSAGAQQPGLSVFTRSGDGTIRHFYTAEAGTAEGHWNGIDLMSPVWHMFDLLPEGRGDWFPSLEYD